jgi:hypothetical protein
MGLIKKNILCMKGDYSGQTKEGVPMIKFRSLFTVRTQSALLILSLVLIISSAACNGTNSASLDEEAFLNAVDTAVAATDAAQAEAAQKTQVAEALLAPTETPIPTATTAAPTSTPEPSFTPNLEETDGTPAPTQASFSPSLSGPAVQVSVDTNCRSGPGKSYTYLGALMVGEQAVIVGKDPSGAYWYITNPDAEGEYCWIWGHYATIAGNTGPLPIFTPGPTPTPDPNFSTAVNQVETCGGFWQIEFEVVNNGIVTLESISTYVKDTVTGNDSATTSKNKFVEMNGCTNVTSVGRLHPDDTGYTVSQDLVNDPTGHSTYVEMTVCTEDGLHGDCRSRAFYVTP